MSYPILQFQQSVTACFQTNESYAPLSLANLFSTFHEVNATYLIDGLTLMNVCRWKCYTTKLTVLNIRGLILRIHKGE